MKGKEVHVLSFDGIVRHAPLSQPTRNEISQQFSQAIPRQLIVPVDSDFFVFEATSEWTDVATRYVIGLAALASGDVAYAEGLLLEVERQIASGKGHAPPLLAIGQKLPRYLRQMYEAWLARLIVLHVQSRDDDLLPQLDAVSKKLLERDPNNVRARLSAAICSFLDGRNLADARRHLYHAKKYATDPTWQYSIAFLEAYEGNLDNAEKEYEEAFRGVLQDITVPIQCEEFIQLIVDREPDRAQLHFCSGLINFYPKRDYSSAVADFQTFLTETDAMRYRPQRERAAKLLAEARNRVAV